MYSENSFKNLRFDPMNSKEMLKAYPELKEIVPDEHLKNKNIDGIIRFVIMVNDPSSILFKNEKNINVRKGYAIDLAKLDTLTENEKVAIQEYSNEATLDISVNYLIKFARSHEFAAIMATEYCFWESIKVATTPVGEDIDMARKKILLKEEMQKDRARLKELFNDFYGEDAILTKAAASKIRPEDYAKILKK